MGASFHCQGMTAAMIGAALKKLVFTSARNWQRTIAVDPKSRDIIVAALERSTLDPQMLEAAAAVVESRVSGEIHTFNFNGFVAQTINGEKEFLTVAFVNKLLHDRAAEIRALGKEP